MTTCVRRGGTTCTLWPAARSLYTPAGELYHRVLQHKRGEIQGFTQKYHINRLVYYETFKYVNNAIKREKQIKAWTRAKRLALIKTMNPTWQDLAEGWGSAVELQIPRSQNQGAEDRLSSKPVARDDKPKNGDLDKKKSVPEKNAERPNPSRSTA